MLVEALRQENVEYIFGYPGGAVLPIYDALYECGIRHILPRHEQGAIHAAEGYARVTGRTGVVIGTSGPGATNLVTGLADAMMDSLPLVVITGQVGTQVLGTDAFQEASIVGITMPVTKHNYQVRNVADLPQVIKEAFHIANSGRPGPVLIDIPKDITQTEGLFDYSQPVKIPGYQPTVVPNRLQIRKVASAIRAAKRPVILAGAGVLHAKANEELLRLVNQTQIPLAHTLLGLGGLPGSHPLFLGMAGMHGTVAANTALYEADLLINIGARFDDRVTGNLAHFAKQAIVVHIDIDPAEIGKNVPTDIPVVGDAGEALRMLLAENLVVTEAADWRESLDKLKQDYPLWYVDTPDELKPQKLIELISEVTKGEAIVVTDVGQHQMWAAQFYGFDRPHRFVTSGGLGTMGFGLPAAIGAQLGRMDSTVIALLGDGGFQMTLQELALLVEYRLPVKVVIVNNGSLGMVRQWQELFFGKRYSESLLRSGPDFIKLAEAYGIRGHRVHSYEEAKDVLSREVQYDGPVLIDCRVTPEENVYPMVPTGKGLHEMVGVKP
ncbi:biosynthetic-type acetolactate synthase large subunit [Alicyclobacillus ferrooxydans]|uniref:Acetolactate synthase n=1 Tax=Alicyclobacillus ferrooxydans TaxID=471514 RepID=A0A0P9D8P4_9BACL|nr:biosynthetic-type acetolactate synthase large subunit [Alicyclobacillus ferrooxydans]KPV45744.1 acetolactate synthase catalytic subunit [Alicyclobacillus ferrooxydans]